MRTIYKKSHLKWRQHERSKFTDEQITFALKQAEMGTPISEICRKMGIAEATFYKWKNKFGGLMPNEFASSLKITSDPTFYQ